MCRPAALHRGMNTTEDFPLPAAHRDRSLSDASDRGSIPSNMSGRSNHAGRIPLIFLLGVDGIRKALEAEKVNIGTQTVDDAVSQGSSVK
jgi:hypothetical protein